MNSSTRPEHWDEEHAPRQLVLCENYDEGGELIAAGRGVGVVPESSSQRSQHSLIRYIPLDNAPPLPVQLIFPAASGHPLLRPFVEAALAELPTAKRDKARPKDT